MIDASAERGCPTAEQLACLVEGQLDEREIAAVMEHAGECEICCDLLASLARAADDGEAEASVRPVRGATFDRYVLREPLGRGAMGVVWSAFDPELQRRVAIKLVAADALEGVSADAAKRLQREAQTMARISHPNVVTVHAVGLVGDRLFIAMDLVDGETLGEWLEDGPRPLEDVLARFLAAGRGLAEAHARGIVHRDFKPDNVLCGRDGRVCVTDFGLARAPVRVDTNPAPHGATEPELARLTRTGAFIGTPAYTAPEQFAGKPTDARSDQFSFCVALWEAVYGMRPFAGRSFDELASNVRAGVVRPPPADRSVPRRLNRALRRGLCLDPDDRWPDMPSLLAAVAPPRARSRRVLAIGGLAVALGSAGLWWVARADAVPRPCTSSAAHLLGVWDDARRNDVREALLASEIDVAEAAARGTIERLDAQADEWIAMHAEACRAAARGERAPAVLDRQMACLDRRRAELEALVDVLARGDADVAEHSIRAASSLPSIAVCGDVDTLASAEPTPEDPVLAAGVALQLSVLARATALSRAGKNEEAESVVTEVVDAAAELEWPPLSAEALVIRGRLRRTLGRFDEGYDDLLRAWELALSSGADKTAARAATEQVALATQRYAFDEGLAWSEHALAAAERLGSDEVIEAQVYSDVGLLRMHRGDQEEAERLLTHALDLLEDAPRPDEVSIAETLTRLGTLALSRQDYPTGMERLQRGIALIEKNLGRDHPQLKAPVLNLGVAHYQRFEYAEAQKLFERALDIATPEGVHPDLVSILTNLGNVHQARGESTLALLFYQRATDMAEELWGPDHIQVGVGLVNVATLQHGMKEYEKARASFQRVLDIWEREMPNHPAVAYPLTGLGVTLSDLHRYDEAIEHLERALAMRSPTTSTPVDIADNERHLAVALWDGGGDKARAVALATSARDRLLPLGENAGVRLAEVQQWLTTHETD